jgi:flagellar biosynthesis/type III secretory pathway protein FliH
MPEEASLSRVLREPAFGAARRLVAFGAERGLPADVQALVAAAAAEAHERGRREGIMEGAAAAARHAAALAGPVAEAIDQGIEQLRRLRAGERAELLELAAAIARAVTGGDPSAGGDRLLGDVAAALEALDDAPLVVAVNSRDSRLLVDGLAGRPGVSVIEDAALRPGEARVRGPWAVAELTRDALWSSVGEALRLGERASPAPAAPRAGADEPVSEDSVN